MERQHGGRVGGTGTVFLAVLCVALLAPPADAATTNVIIDWNLAVNKVIRGAPAGNTTANANAFATFFEPAIGSQPAARYLATLNVAILEAVYAVNGDVRGVIPTSAFASGDLSLATAHLAASFTAHAVATSFFPNWQENAALPVQFDNVVKGHLTDPQFGIYPAISLANNISTVQASQRVAAVVAQAVLLTRVNDGYNRYKPWSFNATAAAAAVPPLYQYRFSGGSGSANDTGAYAGNNQAFALYPQYGDTRGFAISSGADFPPPVSLNAAGTQLNELFPSATATGSSSTYNANLAWVAQYGERNSTARTQYQTDTIYFWRLGGGTSAVPGFFGIIASQLLAQNWTDLASPAALLATARVFALTEVALFDGMSAGWTAKYKYLNWRPETALRLGDNTSTGPLSGGAGYLWTSELVNPGHPEYPSTHSAGCAAAVTVLSSFFGSNASTTIVPEDTRSPRSGNNGFSFAGTTLAGSVLAPRTLTLAQMQAECSASRLFGGIHFNHSTRDGEIIGTQVANFVLANYPGNFTQQVRTALASGAAPAPAVASSPAPISPSPQPQAAPPVSPAPVVAPASPSPKPNPSPPPQLSGAIGGATAAPAWTLVVAGGAIAATSTLHLLLAA